MLLLLGVTTKMIKMEKNKLLIENKEDFFFAELRANGIVVRSGFKMDESKKWQTTVLNDCEYAAITVLLALFLSSTLYGLNTERLTEKQANEQAIELMFNFLSIHKANR